MNTNKDDLTPYDLPDGVKKEEIIQLIWGELGEQRKLEIQQLAADEIQQGRKNINNNILYQQQHKNAYDSSEEQIKDAQESEAKKILPEELKTPITTKEMALFVSKGSLKETKRIDILARMVQQGLLQLIDIYTQMSKQFDDTEGFINWLEQKDSSFRTTKKFDQKILFAMVWNQIDSLDNLYNIAMIRTHTRQIGKLRQLLAEKSDFNSMEDHLAFWDEKIMNDKRQIIKVEISFNTKK